MKSVAIAVAATLYTLAGVAAYQTDQAADLCRPPKDRSVGVSVFIGALWPITALGVGVAAVEFGIPDNSTCGSKPPVAWQP